MYISRAGFGKTSVGINKTNCRPTFTYNLGQVPKKNILKLNRIIFFGNIFNSGYGWLFSTFLGIEVEHCLEMG